MIKIEQFTTKYEILAKISKILNWILSNENVENCKAYSRIIVYASMQQFPYLIR